MELKKRYKVVFFDLGGTLRIALNDEPYMRHARRKMAEIAGTDMPYEDFYQLVEDRYEPYRKWALGENKESGDEELWCKWLLPDYDHVHIAHACHELSFQYRQSKGRRVVVDGGVEVIRTLYQRGYRLGIISNLIGETEVPDWLEEDGLDKYFSSVVLSSVCHLRKPCAEIYRIAPRSWAWTWRTVYPWPTTSSGTCPVPLTLVWAAISSSALLRKSTRWKSPAKSVPMLSSPNSRSCWIFCRL